jgi:hypothetical protein
MKTSKRKTNEQYQSAPLISAAQLAPSPEQIHQRAHDIYVARGGTDGMALDDWLRAEQELKHDNDKH